MKSLAIEREFGSGGRAIGMEVAKLAGIPYYDGNLLLKAAEDYGIRIDLLKDHDENKTGSILYNIAMLTSANRYENQMKINEMFYGIQETILKLEKEGPAVFIGRCSTEILKSSSKVLRVFIYSSDVYKKTCRVMETEEVSKAEAKRLMERKDKQREKYFKFWTQKDWKDRKNYDMEMNTGILSIEECAEILLAKMK